MPNPLSQFDLLSRSALVPLLNLLDRLGVDRVGKTLTVDKYLVTVVAIEGSGTISFVDGGSAQAATGGAVQGRRRRGAGGVRRRGHPRCGENVGVDRLPAAAAAPSLDRVRV